MVTKIRTVVATGGLRWRILKEGKGEISVNLSVPCFILGCATEWGIFLFILP